MKWMWRIQQILCLGAAFLCISAHDVPGALLNAVLAIYGLMQETSDAT